MTNTTHTDTFHFTGWFTKDGQRATRDQITHAWSSLVRRWHSDCGRWRVDFSAQTGASIWSVRAGGDRWLRDGGWDRSSVIDAFSWCRWRGNHHDF